MQIFVKTLTGKRLSLDVEVDYTILEVKEIFQALLANPYKPRLVYAGKELEDERTLSDYNVKSGHTLHHVLRLRGMISTFTSTDTTNPLIRYLMLTEEDRQAAAIPIGALRNKAKSEGANNHSTFCFWPHRRYVSDEQCGLFCNFLNYMWDKSASESMSDRVDMRLSIEEGHFRRLLALLGDPPDHPFSSRAVVTALLDAFDYVPGSSGRAKFALRMTRGPTNACIDFHCDGCYATSTCQVALNEPTEYDGGRLCFFVNDEVKVLERPTGSLVSHPPSVLHGVTSLTSGTRNSLFVVDKSNGLGERGVIQVTGDDIDGFASVQIIQPSDRRTQGNVGNCVICH